MLRKFTRIRLPRIRLPSIRIHLHLTCFESTCTLISDGRNQTPVNVRRRARADSHGGSHRRLAARHPDHYQSGGSLSCTHASNSFRGQQCRLLYRRCRDPAHAQLAQDVYGASSHISRRGVVSFPLVSMCYACGFTRHDRVLFSRLNTCLQPVCRFWVHVPAGFNPTDAPTSHRVATRLSLLRACWFLLHSHSRSVACHHGVFGLFNRRRS